MTKTMMKKSKIRRQKQEAREMREAMMKKMETNARTKTKSR